MKGKFLLSSYSHGFHVYRRDHACIRSNSALRPQYESRQCSCAALLKLHLVMQSGLNSCILTQGTSQGVWLGGMILLVLCHWANQRSTNSSNLQSWQPFLSSEFLMKNSCYSYFVWGNPSCALITYFSSTEHAVLLALNIFIQSLAALLLLAE